MPLLVSQVPVLHMTIRVFLVDDHELVRCGLRQKLEAEDDMVVVGEAESAEEALQLVAAAAPDVAVLDVSMPGGSGVELSRELRARHPDLITLMLSAFGDDESRLAALMAGAAGFVLKNLKGPDLVASIRRVAANESLFDAAENERLLEHVRSGRDDADPLVRLTPQEERILTLVAEGCTNRQIGERMFLSPKTVKNYVSTLLRKLGMKRRTEAAVYATLRAQGRTSAYALPGRKPPTS